MKDRARRLTGIALAVSFVAPVCSAHEREFTQSRDWFLPYKGEHEVEWRSFVDTTHGEYLAQIEYEYGVTEWFAIEPGLEIKEKPGGEEYEVEGAELELRFHFMEFAYDKPLPALNVEYEHPFEEEDGDEDKIELKGVLSWYGESGNDFALNLNYGKEITGEKEDESELTAGWVTPLHEEAMPSAGWHSGVRAGLELVQDLDHGLARVGPLAVYRPMEHLNLLAHYGFALDERDGQNHDELALIVEWEF